MTDTATADAHGLTPKGAEAWGGVIADALTDGALTDNERMTDDQVAAAVRALLPIVSTLTGHGAAAAVRSVHQRAYDVALPRELTDYLTFGIDTAANAGYRSMARDHFQAIAETPDGQRLVAEHIRCGACGSLTTQAGIDGPQEWTLARLGQMADRHECTPRFLDPTNGFSGRHRVKGGRAVHATRMVITNSVGNHVGACGAPMRGGQPAGHEAAVTCRACLKALDHAWRAADTPAAPARLEIVVWRDPDTCNTLTFIRDGRQVEPDAIGIRVYDVDPARRHGTERTEWLTSMEADADSASPAAAALIHDLITP